MLPRFHHILVPVDAVPKNSAAVDIAFELAVENKASVSLLHVIQAISTNGEPADQETQQFYNQIEQRVSTDMERIAQRFKDARIDIEHKVRVGDRLRDIVEFSNTHKVDLIVMSSHRVDPTNLQETWGTLSYQVSVVCECPILLVK